MSALSLCNLATILLPVSGLHLSLQGCLVSLTFYSTVELLWEILSTWQWSQFWEVPSEGGNRWMARWVGDRKKQRLPRSHTAETKV